MVGTSVYLVGFGLKGTAYFMEQAYVSPRHEVIRSCLSPFAHIFQRIGCIQRLCPV